MTILAGIDAGTQSVKVVVYDADAREVLDHASAPLELISGEDGSREQHPADWVRAVQVCFDSIDPLLRKRIEALAVSAQQHGFVPVDHGGNVLAPAKLWNDTSTTDECAQIMDSVGGVQNTIAIAGNPILAGYTASKVAWTRRHRPDVYSKMAMMLLPHDYLNFVLTGRYFCEYGDASGTGWLDVRKRQWSMEMLRATDPQRDLSKCLPPLVAHDALFEIDPACAARLGLASTVKVAVGGGDNMMAAIGTGCVEEGRLAMSLGTSGTLFAHSDVPMVEAEGGWAAFCSSDGGWLPLICTMNCTVATEQVARLFGFDSRQGDIHLQMTPPGAKGLSFLPFLNGERTPDLPLGKAMLSGLDADNMSPPYLYRAAMEGATYSLKYGYDIFTRAGMRFSRIILTGGGANSAAWRQLVADVFELPVEVPKHGESAAFGAALQALWALHRARGDHITLADITRAHATINPALSATPNPENSDVYRTAYQRFLHHLDAAIPLYTNRKTPT